MTESSRRRAPLSRPHADSRRRDVAWTSAGQDGANDGVFARRFSSAGAALASEFQVNTYTSEQQGPASVTASASGAFVVVWQSKYGQDGQAEGIFGQRYTTHAILDVDGDGAVAPLTDGLLVLRSLFGFTGSTLTAGAVDLVDCSRCDAAAIEPYLAGLGLVLDGDGDGAAEPLTDGLLVLRFLFGFTGATLVNGAVDTQNCARCDAPAIQAYLQTLI